MVRDGGVMKAGVGDAERAVTASCSGVTALR
jgi:hypothetical protein